MKFIGHVHGADAYRATTGLLHAKGIPTYARFSGAPGRLPTPYRVAIFVHFNRQYDDAIAVLRDPAHVVSAPVDVEHFERFQLDRPTSPLIYKWILYIAIAVIVSLASVFWLSSRAGATTPDSSLLRNWLSSPAPSMRRKP